jgi:hypothetical protein
VGQFVESGTISVEEGQFSGRGTNYVEWDYLLREGLNFGTGTIYWEWDYLFGTGTI